jgi:hypothetical protein
MKLNRLFQIIKEEIHDFYSDGQMYDPNEPSVADKMFTNKFGYSNKSIEKEEANGELVGYVDKMWLNKLEKSVPVYKNPKTLNGFTKDVRGILDKNGDFYLAQSYHAMHNNILEILSEKGIIPYTSVFSYGENYPDEFVAVMRASDSNMFGLSTAYEDVPVYYRAMFDNANKKFPYKFNINTI